MEDDDFRIHWAQNNDNFEYDRTGMSLQGSDIRSDEVGNFFGNIRILNEGVDGTKINAAIDGEKLKLKYDFDLSYYDQSLSDNVTLSFESELGHNLGLSFSDFDNYSYDFGEFNWGLNGDHGSITFADGALSRLNDGVYVPESDWAKVDYLLLNGIRDEAVGANVPATYFDPNVSNSFFGSLGLEGVAHAAIDQVPLYGDLDDAMHLDPFMPPALAFLRDGFVPFDKIDTLSVAKAAIFGTSTQTTKIIDKLNVISANQSDSFVPLAYSGGGQPLLAALNTPKADGSFHNIETLVLVGTPILNSAIINPNVKRVINITSDKDGLNPLIPNSFGGKETINIRLNGDLLHTDFFTRPDRAGFTPDVALLSDKFLATVMDQARDQAQFDEFISRFELKPEGNSNRVPSAKQKYRYEVDLFKWAEENNINIADLRSQKQV